MCIKIPHLKIGISKCWTLVANIKISKQAISCIKIYPLQGPITYLNTSRFAQKQIIYDKRLLEWFKCLLVISYILSVSIYFTDKAPWLISNTWFPVDKHIFVFKKVITQNQTSTSWKFPISTSPTTYEKNQADMGL